MNIFKKMYLWPLEIILLLYTCFLTLVGIFLITFGLREFTLMLGRTIWAPVVCKIYGIKVIVKGAENVDFKRVNVYVSNHQSMLDIVILFGAIKANLFFIAKKELRNIPFFGWYMRAVGNIFIDRGNNERALASMRKAAVYIRNGRNIIAFPEGTRSHDGNIREFKKGAFFMAIEAGVPIVPVAIQGAFSLWPRGTLLVHPGTVYVNFGEPIPTTGLTTADVKQLAISTRDEMVKIQKKL